jgi:hypothetical protein
MNHRSVNRQTSQSSYRPATQSNGMGFSRTKAESAGGGTRSFTQDFNMEHSASSAGATRLRASSASDQSDQASSPNCVYLG